MRCFQARPHDPSESVRRRGVPAGADRHATLRGMRADEREGNGLCQRPSQQPSDQQPMGTAFRPINFLYRDIATSANERFW
jgi:hypothetical protein